MISISLLLTSVRISPGDQGEICVASVAISRFLEYKLAMQAIDKEEAPAVKMSEKVSSSEENLAGIEWDETDEKRIRQRMDWRIVPTVFCLYLLCFIDR